MTNERRLASALLLYCQDHDGRLPPPEYESAPGKWRHWFGLLQAYVPNDERFVCPQLNVEGARERARGYLFSASYALNGRFFGVFGPGPFPLENLELPAQTAMIVEAGTFGAAASRSARPWIAPVYRDLVREPDAYPAPHGGKTNVAAADGHVVSLKIPDARPDGHDPLLGRIAGSIYNWNGGHPNGETAGPPHE